MFRSNKAYLTDLGQSCLNLYRIIPGGALVVFPSYPFLSTCIDHWKSIGLWDKMTACKVNSYSLQTVYFLYTFGVLQESNDQNS